MIRQYRGIIKRNRLLGKYIFHAKKGILPFFSVTHSDLFEGVGKLLGKVIEIGGPNRIYYLDENGKKKYVSDGGVGYFCNSTDEVNILLELKSDADEKYKALKENFIKNYKDSVDRVVTPCSVEKI